MDRGDGHTPEKIILNLVFFIPNTTWDLHSKVDLHHLDNTTGSSMAHTRQYF